MSIAIALSTMWAQQPRFERGEGAQGVLGGMYAFAEVAKAAGYSHIEVSHATDEAGLRTLMRGDVLPLSSLHAPTPRVRAENGRWNTDLNLAATVEGERLSAIQHTVRTLELAAECGAGNVVVHLGGVNGTGVRADGALRRLWQSGKKDGPEVEAERRAAREQREALAPAAFAAARRSLDELAARAAALGVRIGLECRMWYHEIPLPDEAARLLAEHDPDVVGYWHDVGHAEILDRIGLVPTSEWFERLGGRMIGCHLHDMQGIVDHRAPGTGDVDWSYVARGVADAPVRTLEINQHQPEETLATALTLLRNAGVLPATVALPRTS